MSDDPNRRTMGARLRRQREYFGYTQNEVADYLDIPRTAITQIEQGKRRMDVQELQKLAELYGCTVSFLIEETGTPVDDDSLALVARAAEGLSPEDRDEVLRFAQYLKNRHRSRKA